MPLENKESEGENNGPEKLGKLTRPLEQLSRVREGAGKRLKPNHDASDGEQDIVSYNIEQNIREIRAILVTNAEILDRCVAHMTQDNTATAKSISFTRHSFDVVQILPLSSNTQIITYPERSQKSFDTKPLSELPNGLDDLLICKHKTKPLSMLIDYESFFERSLVLHDEVLGPFLAKLKDHLMTVQVCLGHIDAWVIEPQTNISFLEEIFGVKMKLPFSTQSLTMQCHCPPGTHPSHLLCLRCYKPLSAHDYYKRCDHYGSSYFECKVFQVLKLCENVSAKIEANFEIAKENERAKLSKLLEFMAIE